MTLASGSKLGPYEIVSPLGAGGMGDVWKARDTRLGRIVAIKRLKGEHGKQFEQEARAIASLNHPHICQIYDVGPDYLVLEYVEGKPIQGPLNVEEAIRLAIEIAGAIELAHQKGIIHRDLKPANILVAKDGSAKVLDFGLAKVLTEDADVTQTIEGTIIGTPAYMAPEQAQGKPLDERSDVFSFGSVFYEMLSGKAAFNGSSVAAVLSSVLRDEPRPLNAAAAIDGIVRRCLAKRPSERFQSMAEVRAALQQISQPEQARVLQLPGGLTPLIGRSSELSEVRHLLLRDDVRLVNLTGPAGIGKTRLAIELSRQMENQFGHCWFVELEGVLEPHSVPSAILYGLRLREEDTRSPQLCLIEYLRERAGLLFLDNFEQIAEAAPLLQQLLASCPRLKILVTSRALLHLRAEREYVVPPLPNCGTGGTLEELLGMPAVALFLDRAPTLKPTEDAARAIAEICNRLDGLPLAIELAAVRSKLLSPHAILGRLSNPFQLLGGGSRDLPERQQTLRHAIDWSYELLSPGEKRLLQRLSVFSGGSNVESVEAVCTGSDGDTLDLLTALADKSLLKLENQNGNVRIRMMDTIREYAAERLEKEGDGASVSAQHATYYLTFAEEMDRRRKGGSQREYYDSLEGDQSNCLTAVDCFLLQRNAEGALRMVIALWPFWEARGYWTVGREQLRRVLMETKEVGATSARAKAHYAAGVLADAQGDYPTAYKAFEEYLTIQRLGSDPGALAAGMNNLGIVALRQGDHDAARAKYLEALEILRSLDSQQGIAQCLNNLGHVAMAKGDYATARENYSESLAICRRLHSTRDVAWTLSNLGDVAREESQLGEAESLYSQCLGLFREINDQAGLASCMCDLGNLAVLQERYRIAAQLYQESLVAFGELGDRRGIVRTLEGFATMASARGRAEVALRIAGAASAVRNTLGLKRTRAQQLRLETIVTTARTEMGRQAERLWLEGERMALDTALEYALKSAAL
jgi:predicted ATPase/Tfp pilus assembly protein PilF/predicted Ser/Thr protein kinase